MQHSIIGLPRRTINHLARARQLAICACMLAALVAGGAAHARTRWQHRPVISGTPATTDVAGTAYSFTPTASGPRGYKLTFAVSGKPAWASFNTATGQLWGTPTAAGRFANIVISVRDGIARTSLAPFTITVSAPASATPPPPTISGTPATTDVAGTAYTFTPQASDSNGAALSFSVQNLPSWAIFSIATGTLSGTPATANAGTYSDIVISVSNGTGSAALAPFSITVSQPVTSGSATLSWTAPVDNTNGTALTDLAGYNVYYGTSPTAMTTVVNIASAGTTTYTVGNLAAGTWYFAVNAYTTSGTESALSSTGSKTIP